MASYLRMPSVSADSDEAILQSWQVSAGQEIHEGDPIATVETEKATVDIESDQEAVVHALVAEPGAVVAVGSPIAVLLGIGEDGAAADALLAGLTSAPAAAPSGDGNGAGPGPRGITDLDHPQDAIAPELDAEGKEPGRLPSPVAAKKPETPAPPAPAVTTGEAPESRHGRIFASPIARRLAQEQGIDLEGIDGTGPRGRILRRDVERMRDQRGVAPAADGPTAPAAAPSRPPVTRAAASPGAAGYSEIPHSRFRKAVASRLQASKQSAPHFYLRATIRVDALLALRAQLAASGTRASLNDLLVKAAARALADVPAMNVSWTDDAIRQYDSVDIGVAIASDKGLLTPVVRSADQLSLSALAARISDLVARASEGRLQQSELEGGTLTVTNLGMYGVDEFAAIINPPQAAILAVGAVTRVPVVGEDDALEAGSLMTVTLSVDHRPVDGVLAATWLKRLRELLETPLSVLA